MSVLYDPVYGFFAIVAVIAIVGAFYGEFCSKMVFRLARGHFKGFTALTPSFCPNCGKQIPLKYKIPIISYINLKGKCNRCGASISRRYLFFEVVGMLLPIFLFWYENFSVLAFVDYIVIMSVLTNLYICLDTEMFSSKISLFLFLPGFLRTYLDSNNFRDQGEGLLLGAVLIVIFCFILKIRKRAVNYCIFASALGYYFGLKGTILLFIVFSLLLIGEKIYNAFEHKKRLPPGVFFAGASIIQVLVGDKLLEFSEKALIFIFS